MIIYKTTNLINGMIYVGMDSHDNPNYFGSGKLINRAIIKYGVTNFTKETLEVCDLGNIYEREKYWIEKLNSRNKKTGYNLCVGGRGCLGYKWNKKQREQKSQWMKLHPVKSSLGKKWSPELRKKQIASRIGHKCNKKTREALLRANIGKTCSDEKKQKISKGNKEYWTAYYKIHKRDPATSAKLSRRLKSYWKNREMSEEMKKKRSDASKAWWKRDRENIIKNLNKARRERLYDRKQNA